MQDQPGPGTDAETMHPAFIDKTLSQVSARPGELMAELASGAVVRVSDMRVPRVVGFVSMSRELPASLSVFAGMLPDGAASLRVPGWS